MPERSPFPAAVLVAAAALPPLLAFNLTPATTLFNQLLALAGWGLVLAWWAGVAPGWWRGLRSPAALALLLLLVAPFSATLWRALPASLAWNATAVIAAGLAVLLLAQGLSEDARRRAGEALCWGLLIAGLASVLISLVQVFKPDWADGTLIARSGLPGRAISNLRQPNHLASLMMWSAVAAVYLAQLRRWRWQLPVLLAAFVFAVVLSASRTGFIGIAMLALWGLLDRQLPRDKRLSLLATPLMLGLAWWLMAEWAQHSGHAFGAESRLAEGAGSPSRLAILHDAWGLVQAHPWLGVGWGEFNVAWSLTPFPHRPIAFFDHTHNLVMQLVVELGLPWAGAILALLVAALWQVWRGSAGDAQPALRRAALMMVLTIGLHSLLEYPLWYAYFLLPACFALGLALPMPAGGRAPGVPLALLGGVLAAGSVFAVWDYSRIVAIYAPSEDDAPLMQRIATGQRSPLFGHQADYAAATSQPPGPAALVAARRTAFSLVDARLLKHWSQSLEVTGDVDGARYLADRLREFRNPTGDEWFAACARAAEAASAPAMPQCQPVQQAHDWMSFFPR